MKPSVLKFLEDVGKLKLVAREGWKLRGVKNPESVAEHSFRTAFIAMMLSDIEKCNTQNVLKMALLHDLQESKTGDLTVFSKNYVKKKALEKKAIKKIFNSLPKKLRKEYLKIWKEYEEGSTKEAKLVKQADKLELLIQAAEYEKHGYNVSDFWTEEYEFEGLCREIYNNLKNRK